MDAEVKTAIEALEKRVAALEALTKPNPYPGLAISGGGPKP
jgi:hypothetical protein